MDVPADPVKIFRTAIIITWRRLLLLEVSRSTVEVWHPQIAAVKWMCLKKRDNLVQATNI